MNRSLSILIMLAPALASADGVRGQGFVVDGHVGPGALHDDTTAPAVLYGLGFGFAVDPAATFAVGVELDGLASWTNGIRRDRASFLGTGTVWFGERVSLKLGAGIPVGPSAIGEGFAAFGRVGYEIRRYTQTALVISVDVHEDTTAGPQISALIGFEVFTREKTMNLWDPNLNPRNPRNPF